MAYCVVVVAGPALAGEMGLHGVVAGSLAVQSGWGGAQWAAGAAPGPPPMPPLPPPKPQPRQLPELIPQVCETNICRTCSLII